MKKEHNYFAPGTVKAYTTAGMRKQRRWDWGCAADLVVLAFTLALLFVQPSKASAFGPFAVSPTVRVVDGDTFAAMFEVYPGVWLQRNVRVLGADTPEKSSNQACERKLAQAAQLYAANYIAQAIQTKQPIMLWHVAEDKYGGRIDATVTVQGKDLAHTLIESGHGRPYAGGKRKPWCNDATGPPIVSPLLPGTMKGVTT